MKCAWCDMEFKPKSHRQKYCNRDCAYENQKHRQKKGEYEKNCLLCDVPFKSRHQETEFCNKCRISKEAREYIKQREGIGEKERPFGHDTNQNIAIMDFRGAHIRTIADTFNRSLESVKNQLELIKKNGTYDRIIKAYLIQQPSERKLLNKGA